MPFTWLGEIAACHHTTLAMKNGLDIIISHITIHEHMTADGIHHSSNHLIMSVTTASFRRLQTIFYVATWDVRNNCMYYTDNVMLM